VTAYDSPATLTLATRRPPVLAAMVRPTDPFALPFCPDAIAIQLCDGTAVQLHPASVETSKPRRPPLDPIASPERLSENRQGAAAWLTATLDAPTEMDPERGVGTELAATEYPIDASPCPDRSPLIVTHAEFDETVQVQSRAVDTATVPLPPVDVNVDADVVALTSHRLDDAVGAVTEVSVDVHAESVAAAPTASRIREHISNVPADLMHAARQRGWRDLRRSRFDDRRRTPAAAAARSSVTIAV